MLASDPVFPTIEMARAASFLRPFRVRVDLSGERASLFISLSHGAFQLEHLIAAIQYLEKEGWLLPLGITNCWQAHPQLMHLLSVSEDAERIHYQFFAQLSNTWIEQEETGDDERMEKIFPLQNAENLEKAIQTALKSGFSLEKPLYALDIFDKNLGNHAKRIARMQDIIAALEQNNNLQRFPIPSFDLIACLDLLGDAYHQYGQLREAERIYRKILDSTSQSESHLLLSARLNALIHLIGILREHQDWKEGEIFMQMAEILAATLDVPALQVDVFWAIGLWFKELHNQEKAKAYLQKAVDMTHDSYKKGLLLVNLAALADDAGEVEHALQLNFEALEILKNHAPSAPLGSVYSNIGLLYERKRELQKASSFTRMALEWHLSRENWWSVGECYQNLANFLLSDRKLAAAEEYYLRAMQAYERADHSIAIGGIYQNLGELKRFDGLYEAAIRYGQKAIDLYEHQGDQSREADARLNIGNAFMQTERFEEAWKTWERAEKLFETLENPIALGLVARNRAEWSRRKGEDERGQAFLESAAEFFGSVKAEYEAAELIAYTNLFANLTKKQTVLDRVSTVLNRHFDETTMFQLLKNAAAIYQRMA